MIYPICLYGLPVLRRVAEAITPDYPNLDTLIADMFDTLTKSEGVGLAAPQIGLSIKLFVTDLTLMGGDFPEAEKVKRVLINPEILETSGENVTMEEGCLSFPGIHENVTRRDTIHIHYFNEHFEERDEVFSGFTARVMQHEYDHLQGKAFIDHLSPIRKQLIKNKLKSILNGKCSCDYKVKGVKK